MARVCNTLFFLANLIAFISSIPILAMAWLMKTNKHTHCDQHMYPQVLETGLVLLIISLVGLIGQCYRIKGLLWTYLVLILIRIVVHLIFTGLSFVAIQKQQAYHIDYSKGDEYKIEHFAGFARKYLDGENWEATRSCVIKYNICDRFGDHSSDMSPKEFMLHRPIMWGCCQPPATCGYRHENGTLWTVLETGIQSNNTDCYKYSNNKEVLCSNCDTCKAGFLAFVFGDWRKLLMTNAAILGLFFIMLFADISVIRHLRSVEDVASNRYSS